MLAAMRGGALNLHRLPILALLSANAISQVGNVLTLIAVPWFVLETTGSAAKVGLTGFAATLPVVIAGLLGGALVDRFGFRRISVLSDVASGVTVALIPLLHILIGLAFWQLLVLVFLGALLDAPGHTARQSLLPDLAHAAGMPLERANAAEQAINKLSYLIGPPAAGLLVVVLGTQNVLWLDAASFALSAVLVALAVPATRARATTEQPPATRYLDDLRAGLGFIRGDTLILGVFTSIATMNFIDSMIFTAYPIYAERLFGSAVQLGLMLSVSAIGALVSVLAFAVVGHRLPRRETFIWSFVLSGLPLWALAWTPGLVVTLAVLAVRGIGAGPLNPILMTATQQRVPADMRGRVFGPLAAFAMATVALGRLAGGYSIEAFGLAPTLAGLAAAYLCVTLSMLAMPAFRQLNDPAGASVRTTYAARGRRAAAMTTSGGE
jgi:MFS family permease